MLLEPDAARRSQTCLTDASPHVFSCTSTPSCRGRHQLETSDLPVWRGVQRKSHLLTATLPNHLHCDAGEAQQAAQRRGLYTGRSNQDLNPFTTAESEARELERTKQLMAVANKKRDHGASCNLVRRQPCWSGLTQLSRTSLVTATLCVVSIFLLNRPVAAEKPFHHRDMRDEAILNPPRSFFFVDNLPAATVRTARCTLQSCCGGSQGTFCVARPKPSLSSFKISLFHGEDLALDLWSS